jgi:hypothetical protein
VTQVPGQAEAVVQRQLDAYNRRDLDAFIACYASDAKLYRPPHQLAMDGHGAIAQRYRALFDQSPPRIVLDRFVVDHEHVEGQPKGAFDALATYEVADRLIVNAWFVVP